MFQAILKKEFLKIKYIYLALLFFLFSTMLYLYIDILTNFLGIEPHSMLWYQAIFIGDIYYDILKFLPSICALVIALTQFLPEVHKKKFRIPLHLPVNQNKMVFLYLFVGLFLLTLINLLFIFGLYFISLTYYPRLIVSSAILNTLPWLLASYIIYNATVAIMIEPFWKRKAFLSVLFLLLASMLFFNSEYEAYNNILFFYTFILLLTFLVPLLSLYRFKNGNTALNEHPSIISKGAIFTLIFFSFLTLGFYLPHIVKQLSKDNSLATYVFYSPTKEKFVYKKHFGEHNFAYGDNLERSFNQKDFEEALPFIYWKNLDIQKKLPLVINGVKYNKSEIKKARQSFKLDYKDLKETNKQIQLYPLFNPNSKKGTISFPKHMFNLDAGFLLLDSETNKIDKKLGESYNKLFNEKKFSFPAKIIAGKTTNIKPLDEGYFILDSKNNLFHMKVYDDIMSLNKINYNKNIKISNIKISESRKKEFYGILLTKDNEVYIILYKNYKLIKLPLKNYNPINMKLEIYANPLNKLVRFQDDKNVFAYAFDKNFNYVSDFKTSIPQVNNTYTKIFDLLSTFHIENNKFKNYEEYIFKLHSYKSFIFSSILALAFFLTFRKKEFMPTLIKSLLLLFGGIYALCFIAFL